MPQLNPMVTLLSGLLKLIALETSIHLLRLYCKGFLQPIYMTLYVLNINYTSPVEVCLKNFLTICHSLVC